MHAGPVQTVKLFHGEIREKQFGDEEQSEMLECKLLECDSITQAKEKAMDVIYAKVPFSKRPSADDVELRESRFSFFGLGLLC